MLFGVRRTNVVLHETVNPAGAALPVKLTVPLKLERLVRVIRADFPPWPMFMLTVDEVTLKSPTWTVV